MLGGFGKSRATPGLSHSALRPDTPFYAIGDIHGCFDEMQLALARVDDDIETRGVDNPHVVFLGDYVDRGKNSARVLEFLITLSGSEPDAVTCLKGNHEQMMLEFLNAPVRAGKRWLRHGGGETLASFGIESPANPDDTEALYQASEELFDALPDGAEAWLDALPLHWNSGNLHCVHAAMDPARTPLNQDPETLLWGHENFLTTPRDDGAWVVHGHTIVDEPTIHDGRISLDTGCYTTGVLTAAAFTGPACRLL